MRIQPDRASAVMVAMEQLGDVRLLLSSSPTTLRALELGTNAIDYLCSDLARAESESDLRWLEQSGATLLPSGSDRMRLARRGVRIGPGHRATPRASPLDR